MIAAEMSMQKVIYLNTKLLTRAEVGETVKGFLHEVKEVRPLPIVL